MHRFPLVMAIAVSSFVAGVGLLAESAEKSPPAAMQVLLATLSERLALADAIALTKWDNVSSVQDSQREAQMIISAMGQAADLGLDSENVGQLMAAQIEASKLVQYGLMAKWRRYGTAPKAPHPDLLVQIRPQLDELQVRMLAQYANFSPYRSNPKCELWLNTALTHMNHDTLHDLAMIRATGGLCSSVHDD